MKVICMTLENFSGIAVVDESHPEVGEIVTVIGEATHKGVAVYYFEEYQSGSWIIVWGYDKRNYSQIPDIDECELVNEKEEVYA